MAHGTYTPRKPDTFHRHSATLAGRRAAASQRGLRQMGLIRARLRAALFAAGPGSATGRRIRRLLTRLDVLFTPRGDSARGRTAPAGELPPDSPLAVYIDLLPVLRRPHAFSRPAPAPAGWGDHTAGNTAWPTSGNAFRPTSGNRFARLFSALLTLAFPDAVTRGEITGAAAPRWMPKAILAAIGLGVTGLAYEAKGATVLYEPLPTEFPKIQTEYTLLPLTGDTYVTSNSIEWKNDSDDVTSNNQIEANGNWGETDTGLYKITIPSTSKHYGEDTLPNIQNNSFTIQYASGVVNPPNGGSDTFTLHYDLGTNNEALAQSVVNELNTIIADPASFASAVFTGQRQINAVARGPPPFDFYNNSEDGPTVFVPLYEAINPTIPEPHSIALLALGALGLATQRYNQKRN